MNTRRSDSGVQAKPVRTTYSFTKDCRKPVKQLAIEILKSGGSFELPWSLSFMIQRDDEFAETRSSIDPVTRMTKLHSTPRIESTRMSVLIPPQSRVTVTTVTTGGSLQKKQLKVYIHDAGVNGLKGIAMMLTNDIDRSTIKLGQTNGKVGGRHSRASGSVSKKDSP